MTANELFLRHVSKHLGQYQGNLRWLCEAVDNGHVPPADDESIRPHVQLLKRQMGITILSDEDEYLLRFGLIVPGLMRGIRPPVSVLNSERGGFSDKRLEQAAGQVSRLREALSTARRHFGNFSPNAVTALRELAEQLKGVAHPDNVWVAMHSALSDTEADALAKRAFACLDDAAESRDLGVGILNSLANFRREGLGAQTIEAFRRELFWPSSIYRDAPDDVANRLIERIEKARGLELNHLLLALAWTRGEPALCAFLRWRKTSPAWASGLYVPLEDYLHHAGWALDANGERRNLVSLSCHRITPSTDASTERFAVPCRKEVDKHCPACGGSLAWLFDFINLPDEFFSGDRTNAPRRVLCCLDCACFCPAVFSRYQPDGTVELHSATNFEAKESFGGRPPSIRELVLAPLPPFSASEPFGIDDATTLGGVPMWLQDAQHPRCPECQNVMKFLAQFDSSSMKPPEEGIYYSFFCPDCRIAAVNYQQT